MSLAQAVLLVLLACSHMAQCGSHQCRSITSHHCSSGPSWASPSCKAAGWQNGYSASWWRWRAISKTLGIVTVFEGLQGFLAHSFGMHVGLLITLCHKGVHLGAETHEFSDWVLTSLRFEDADLSIPFVLFLFNQSQKYTFSFQCLPTGLLS